MRFDSFARGERIDLAPAGDEVGEREASASA
jgi:hypothetical protein